MDLSANWRLKLGSAGNVTLSLNSTYINTYEYQDYKDGPWNQNVGVYVGVNPVFKWQHALAARWNFGVWTAGATAFYKSGYIDQDPSNTVKSYTTVDAYVGVDVAKQFNLTFGIKNLFDRDPPYSNQDEVFQANYDPRFADPTGRKFYARASYKF